MLRQGLAITGGLLLLVCQGNGESRIVEGLRDESMMTYHLVHPLHKIEAVSNEVEYRVEIDVATKAITMVSAHVDVTSYNSGNSSRDSHAMEVVDALTYPDASFISTAVERQGDSLLVRGQLTFHGVTRDDVIRARVTWSEHRVLVEGAFDISLEAFRVERPSLLLIPVEDTLRFSFTAAFPWEQKTP
jgi:polyisoprenoid-binding protein YceI